MLNTCPALQLHAQPCTLSLSVTVLFLLLCCEIIKTLRTSPPTLWRQSYPAEPVGLSRVLLSQPSPGPSAQIICSFHPLLITRASSPHQALCPASNQCPNDTLPSEEQCNFPKPGSFLPLQMSDTQRVLSKLYQEMEQDKKGCGQE